MYNANDAATQHLPEVLLHHTQHLLLTHNVNATSALPHTSSFGQNNFFFGGKAAMSR